MSDMILELQNVQRTYKMGKNCIEVLKDVNLALPKGEWCCVYGASGSGKTTLLNLVGSLERPDGGKVIINGVDISTFKRKQAAEFRLRYLGFIFQSYHLLSELTVLENVTLPGEISGTPRSQVRTQALELLEKVGLANRLKHRPSELSGGEQ
ncbi:MAG: ATP-binding cassette domain-containing protein [Lentisphaeria bacterium]|nr:ATP-binding cassette domain-containing protein [Lentisphaeria bacterium]